MKEKYDSYYLHRKRIDIAIDRGINHFSIMAYSSLWLKVNNGISVHDGVLSRQYSSIDKGNWQHE